MANFEWRVASGEWRILSFEFCSRSVSVGDILSCLLSPFFMLSSHRLLPIAYFSFDSVMQEYFLVDGLC